MGKVVLRIYTTDGKVFPEYYEDTSKAVEIAMRIMKRGYIAKPEKEKGAYSRCKIYPAPQITRMEIIYPHGELPLDE